MCSCLADLLTKPFQACTGSTGGQKGRFTSPQTATVGAKVMDVIVEEFTGLVTDALVAVTEQPSPVARNCPL